MKILSTHRIEVVPVTLIKHPNADALSVVNVHGYQVVVRTEDWANRATGAYIPPDNIVDTTRPEFNFLGKHSRIRAKKIRGILSFGLLVPSDVCVVGQDVTELLGVTHYEPEEFHGPSACAPEVKGPSLPYPKYDIESGRRYGGEVYQEGEQVIITEKIHGASAKIVWSEGKFHVGSRNRWIEEGDNLYWRAMCPEVREYCEKHPDHILWGEVYGRVQKGFPYDSEGVSFRAFDVMYKGAFFSWHDCPILLVPWVPIIGERAYNFENICNYAEGTSLIGNHVREGVVVKPLKERWNDTIGRVALKWVGAGYLEGK